MAVGWGGLRRVRGRTFGVASGWRRGFFCGRLRVLRAHAEKVRFRKHSLALPYVNMATTVNTHRVPWKTRSVWERRTRSQDFTYEATTLVSILKSVGSSCINVESPQIPENHVPEGNSAGYLSARGFAT